MTENRNAKSKMQYINNPLRRPSAPKRSSFKIFADGPRVIADVEQHRADANDVNSPPVNDVSYCVRQVFNLMDRTAVFRQNEYAGILDAKTASNNGVDPGAHKDASNT